MKMPPDWSPDDPRRAPVTLRGQYRAQGFNDRALALMVRNGVLAKPRRGAYVAGSIWREADAEGQHSIRARAVIAQAKTEVALSHTSGLLEYDAPTWGLALDDVHVTRLDGRTGRPEAGVRQHRGVVEEGDILQRNGVPVMSPTRLALEVTTLAGVEGGLVVVNDLLHRGLTTRQALQDRYRSMAHWPHSLSTDVVLRLADPRVETVGESRCLHMLFRHSLPAPVPQYEIKDRAGRVLWRVDFAWPELGVFLEFDGKVKYEKLLRKDERASDVVIAEKRREEAICRLTGWRCVRITWADLERPVRTVEMIRQILASDRVA